MKTPCRIEKTGSEQITEKKPIRVGGVIESARGTFLVQDKKDKHIKETLDKIGCRIRRFREQGRFEQAEREKQAAEMVKKGRFSLPGGKIEPEDYVAAGAEGLIDLSLKELQKFDEESEEMEAFRAVMMEALWREIFEETKLNVDRESIDPILQIIGDTRDHVICFASARGTVQILEKEISGIGFLDRNNVIPMSPEYHSMFYQSHVFSLYKLWINDPNSERYEKMRDLVSNMEIPEPLIDRWQQCLQHGYLHKSPKSRKKVKRKMRPMCSSANFRIFDELGETVRPMKLRSLTQRKIAKLIPPTKGR